MNLRHPRLKVLQVRKRYGRHHHPGMQLVAKDIFELMSVGVFLWDLDKWQSIQ